MPIPRTEEVGNPSALAIDADDLVLHQLPLTYRRRKTFAQAFASRVNQMAELLGAGPFDPTAGADLAAPLHEMGCARAGSLLSPDQVKDLLAYFADRPCFNAHVVAQSDQVESRPDDLAGRAHFGSYRARDVICAPHILELANSPRILDAVGNYLGCVPSLYSMNAWWSFPRPEFGTGITQNFHRDGDDYKNCVLFLYLTDTFADGCHEYIRYSHDPDALSHNMSRRGRFTVELADGEKIAVSEGLDELFEGTGYGRDDIYHTLFNELIEPITGAAGDGFFTDPDGLHRATHPMRKRRLIVWLRYGMHRNCAYVRDLIQPLDRACVAGRLPDTPHARFVNRLVVAPD
jgi:hypothetical protein